MFIYKVVNKKTGQSYVGQTTRSVNTRWRQHIAQAKIHGLAEAINQYGEDAFEVETLCECDSKEELNEKELEYILAEDSLFPNGYNVSLGNPFINGSHFPYYSKESGLRSAVQLPGKFIVKKKNGNHVRLEFRRYLGYIDGKTKMSLVYCGAFPSWEIATQYKENFSEHYRNTGEVLKYHKKTNTVECVMIVESFI